MNMNIVENNYLPHYNLIKQQVFSIKP